MKLSAIEELGLSRIFSSQSSFDRKLVLLIDSAEVLRRDVSEVGFFSTIKFSERLEAKSDYATWVWDFRHPALRQGGGMLAWLNAPDILELEVYANLVPWPPDVDVGLFVDA